MIRFELGLKNLLSNASKHTLASNCLLTIVSMLFFWGLCRKKGPKSCYFRPNQHTYMKNLQPLPLHVSFTEFHSSRMELAWLIHTRPDVSFGVSQMAQVTEVIFAKNSYVEIKLLDQTVNYVLNNPVSIVVPKLDLFSIGLIGFFDASFANNRKHTT